VVNRNSRDPLEERVVQAAEAALAQRKFVSPIDVLVGIRWLPEPVADQWRQGRLPYLEGGMSVNPHKLSSAMRLFRSWAVGSGLRPSETAYVSSTRDHRPLRFTASGEEAVEQAYRTHWVSPELSEKKRERLAERQSRPPDLVAISPLNEWACSLCGGSGAFLLMEETGPVCLACADMDHLVFLPSGDATLSRRAKKASRLSAVVVRFSRARKRYERQGILVEEAALERAEAECLADEEARARGRARAAVRRDQDDLEFQARLAQEIVRLFPRLLAGASRRDRAPRRRPRERPRRADGRRAGAGRRRRQAGRRGLGSPRGHAVRRAADGRRAARRGTGSRVARGGPAPGELAPVRSERAT
jgi:hypothetical protein